MKKIFTLLFATAMLSTAFAQYDQRDRTRENDVYVSNDNRGYDKHDNDRGYNKHDNDRGYNKHDNGRHGGYFFTAREKNMQIAQINREYDYKIQSVKSRFGIGWYQKKRIIYNLEEQRENEIRQVMFKFNSPKNKFGDHGRRDQKRW